MSMPAPPAATGLSRYLDPGQLSTAMRYVYTATGSVLGTLGIVGLSQGDASTIGTAVHQIGDGIVSIATGVAALVPIVSGIYGVIGSSRKAIMHAVNIDPQMAVIAAKPGTDAAVIANSIPGNKVIVATPAVTAAVAASPASVTNLKGAA
jgi:hypothetical protein